MPLSPRRALAPLLVGLLLPGLLLAALPGPAQAQVRRCTTSEGEEVFTDRRCADIGGA